MTLIRLGVGVNGGFLVSLPVFLLAFLTGVSGTLKSGSLVFPFTRSSCWTGLGFFAFVPRALKLAARFLDPLTGLTGFAEAGAMMSDEILVERRTDMTRT